MPTTRLLLLLFCLLPLTVPAVGADEPKPATKEVVEVARRPARKDVLILPLHVHVMTDPSRPELHCKLTDDDLARILGKVNRVWREAGVQFDVQPILREAPQNLEQFDAKAARTARGALGNYRLLANPATRDLPGIHVYYLHELPPNGVYIGGNLCFVKETASLRKVEGGIDEPIPRVTSHEIGHALGLPHRQDRTNLMASGTTGTTFNEAELKIVRQVAEKNKGVMTVADAEAKAKSVEQESPAAADRLRRLLQSICE